MTVGSDQRNLGSTYVFHPSDSLVPNLERAELLKLLGLLVMTVVGWRVRWRVRDEVEIASVDGN